MLTLCRSQPIAPVRKIERRINKVAVGSAVKVIDRLYEGRDYARFYVLETVARVPYFSFVSVLHLYETLGLWRNEYHHLLIMEELGGDERYADRFFAQHVAFFYYWLTCLIYVVSPCMAYNLSEQIEEHAYHTYDEFLKNHGTSLSLEKAPVVASDYYDNVMSLHDVFTRIRDDEGDHVKEMQECQLELDEN
jgi:ubiquinol oxidase